MADRREILTGAAAATLAIAASDGAVARPAGQPRSSAATAATGKAFARKLGPRVRVMVVNDLSGDIDGLFATVHALLSSSAEVRGIVGTAAEATQTAGRAVERAN